MTLAHRAVRGTAIVLVSSYANLAIGFVTTVALTRLLSPEVFGVFALSASVYSAFDIRNKLGLDYALIHAQDATDDHAATHWVLQLCLASITLLVGSVASWVLSSLGYNALVVPILVSLCAIGAVEAAGSTARVLLEKELRFGRSTLVITSALLLSNLSAVALAWAGAGVWSLVAQTGLNALITTIGLWRITPMRPRLTFSGPIARCMLRFGLTMSVGAIASIIFLQGDNYMVGTLVGITALGFYDRAYRVAQWPTGLVTHIVSRAAMPTYAKLQNDKPRLSKAFDLTLWTILSVATPLALALFISAPDFILLIFGEAWLPSAWLLRFLVGYSVMRPLLDDTGALLVAVGKPQRVTQLSLTLAAGLVIFALPLTLLYCAIGTAIGVGISFLVGVAVAYVFVFEVVSLNWRKIFVPPVVALTITLSVYLLITRLFDFNTIPLLARIIVKSGFVGGGFLVLTATLQHDTAARLRYVVRLLQGR